MIRTLLYIDFRSEIMNIDIKIEERKKIENEKRNTHISLCLNSTKKKSCFVCVFFIVKTIFIKP